MILLVFALGVCAAKGLAKSEILVGRDYLALKNEFFWRTFRFDKAGFYTTSYRNLAAQKEYCPSASDEFAFAIDGREVTGSPSSKSFWYDRHTVDVSQPGRRVLHIELVGVLGSPAEKISVGLDYIFYDDSPFLRKGLTIANKSDKEIAITNLDVERLNLIAVSPLLTEVRSNHGQDLTRIPYSGGYNDSVLLVWNPRHEQGILLGNEAFGVLKRTEVYLKPQRIAVGLTRIDQHYPFKKFLAPGEKFTAPRTFVGFYQGEKWQDAFEGRYADFVRTKLGVRFFEKRNYPFSFYNSWEPWHGDINENLLKEAVDAVAGTGFEIFAIDEGWEDALGDWNPDPKKFPNGVKPLCDYIISKGMKPGLWFSIATIFADSKIALQHPEWAIKDKDRKPANLHQIGPWNGHDMVTMSLGTPWYDYNLQKIKQYIRTCRLAYVKIDLAAACSCYVQDYDYAGDYEAKPPFYKDRESSYYALFQRVQDFLDDLHQAFPDVILDCTSEVMGRCNLTDFATIQHADVNWLSNFSWDSAKGTLEIRQLNYDRARVIPPATIFIANPSFEKENSLYGFFSIAQSIPIMLGDPRRLTAERKTWYAKWLAWFKEMERKYRFSAYYQVSDVFDRPAFSNWDGCYKFNKEQEGGVLFFFRNDSPDAERTFRVFCLNPGSTYRIYSPELGKDIGVYKGRDLIGSGLKVRIEKPYTALVLGIEKIK